MNRFAAVLACVIAVSASAAELKVLNVGLGTGTITSTPAGISCRTACRFTFGSESVTLTAVRDSGSTLERWLGDCRMFANTDPCVLDMSEPRFVRAEFRLDPRIAEIPLATLPAENLRTYLETHPEIDSPARFVAALPREFRQNWILMSRSESLQTGTAETPRILLPSRDGRFVFTIGLRTNASYPGSHPYAIEYMQFDDVEKNFRFHEIVLRDIPEMLNTPPPGRMRRVSVPARPTPPARPPTVSIDEARCFQCHSTRNVYNRSTTLAGTTGTSVPRAVPWKNKPNWDSYDSWGGMLPFNRDRIYQGSVEAAAFRKLFNPWTWAAEPDIRAVLELLELQHPTTPAAHSIERQNGGPNDGHVIFAFDGGAIVLNELAPLGNLLPDGTRETFRVSYSFDGRAGTSFNSVQRGGEHVFLHHTADTTGEEGRGVQLFDMLGGLDDFDSGLLGDLNALRIADEINRHTYATGSFEIDVRPIALGILRDCVSISELAAPGDLASLNEAFFNSRNGMGITGVRDDTDARAKLLPRRKADIQKLNLDRRNDPYLAVAEDGLIQRYGMTTSQGTATSVERIRQEIFRRPIDKPSADQSGVMNRAYVDREDYPQNPDKIALFRYFLEPLGVSVDKWSMGVRGRSRTYTFADVFDNQYIPTLTREIEASLRANPRSTGLTAPFNCTTNLRAAFERAVRPSTATTTGLPSATGPAAIPKYTDVQRIFNKACIECHGGLRYPPFDPIFDAEHLDLSEDETSTTSRFERGYRRVTEPRFIQPIAEDSYLFQRITSGDENCPGGIMPCGGPKLSQTDVETIRRWINGGATSSTGDPHIRTIDGTSYDFQSAGEFVLLRGEGIEIQTRQTAVETQTPLGANDYTGLSSCVSVNTAAAFRVGSNRITYQPGPNGLQLRVDGKLATLGERAIHLSSGGRILPTIAPGGLQIEYPGGTDIIVTPGEWAGSWHLNIDVRHARATDGVMGLITPGNWLPALPDGTLPGPRPADLRERYEQLYVRFADAWRVDERTSLFDYAPGTSTASFSLPSWPGFEPQSCRPRLKVPSQPVGRPVPLAVAREHCRGVVDAAQRKNCEQDVMVTGHPGFAETYLRAEAILRNAIPASPKLVSPDADQKELGTTIRFVWNKTADANKDRLVYRQCVWPIGETLTFDQCTQMPAYLTVMDGRNWNWLWLVLLIALLFVILLFVRFRRMRILLLLVAIVLLVAAFLLFRVGSATTITYEVKGLKPGAAYYWTVIAEDGKGGTVQSELRRFATKK